MKVGKPYDLRPLLTPFFAACSKKAIGKSYRKVAWQDLHHTA